MQGITAGGNCRVQTGPRGAFTEGPIGERRLWLAVVMQVVEDWRNGTLRARRKAQEFMFDEKKDFDAVCANAGLDPDNLRSKLMKIGRMVQAQGQFSQYMPA